MKTVYIQYQDNIPITINSYAAEYGFKRMGNQICTFENDVNTIDNFRQSKHLLCNSNNIFVGGIHTLLSILNAFDVNEPITYNPHEYLPNYVHREIHNTTLECARNMIFKKSFFVKPAFDNKLFTGFVAKSEIDLIKLQRLPSHTNVLISSVIDIVSEYRCFVHKGKLVDMKQYNGDFTVFPNIHVIENAIAEFKDQPIAYTLDFAILKDNTMELIEINDFFGIGYCGMNIVTYCKMLDDRWNQLIKNIK